jgi:hypothetical protein
MNFGGFLHDRIGGGEDFGAVPVEGRIDSLAFD